MDGSDMSAAPSSTVTENKSKKRQRLKAELETLLDLSARLEARRLHLLAVAEPTSSHDSRNNMGSDDVAVSCVHGHSRQLQPVASGTGHRHSREGSLSRQNSGTEAEMGNDLDNELDSSVGADIFTKERRAVGARMSVAVNDLEKDGSYHGDTQPIKRRKVAAPHWEGGEGDLAYEGPEAGAWLTNGAQSRSEASLRNGHESVAKRRFADINSEAGRSPKRMKLPSVVPDSIWQFCLEILDELEKETGAWAFSKPVQVLWPNLLEYFDVIKEPQDLGTVRAAIMAGEYSHPKEFARDVRLTFNNALRYNQKTSEFHVTARKMKNKFDSRYRTVERRLLNAVVAVQPSPPHVERSVAPDGKYTSGGQVNGASQRHGHNETDSKAVVDGSGNLASSGPKVAEVDNGLNVSRSGLEDVDRVRASKELRSANHSSKAEKEDAGKTVKWSKSAKKASREKSIPATDPKTGAVVDPRLGRAKSAKAYGGPRPLTNKEKLKLTELVQDLPADRQNMIYQMVSSKVSANSKDAPQQETAEFDMNSIDDLTMFEVFRVTMNWQKSKSKVLGIKSTRTPKGKDDGTTGPTSGKSKHQKSKNVALENGHKGAAEEEDVDIMNDSPTPHRGPGVDAGDLQVGNGAGDQSPRHSSSGSSSNDSSSSSSSGSDSSSSGSESDADSGAKD